jgi:Protein of unknown function (DUF3443)
MSPVLRQLCKSLVISAAIALGGCGGGGSGDSQNGAITPVNGPNVTDLIVDGGPAGTINAPFVSVTLCAPGTANCVTVDHVLVDTASTGLRVMASLLAGLNLPAATDTSSNPLYGCVQFVDGYSWGPLKTADVKVAQELAAGIAIHTIDDSNTPLAPAGVPGDCSNGTPSDNSVQSFGANGVLGIAVFKEDCGAACTTTVVPGTYYTCVSMPCTGTIVALNQQLHNPVTHFATDNNGALIQLPGVGSAGAFAARGVLIFGIDTQSNNQLRSATVLTVNPGTGNFTTSYKGQTFAQSFIDSGSSGYFFNDSTLAQCPSSFATGYYCPASAQTLSATNISYTGISSDVSFNVANAETLVNNQPSYTAFSNLAGSNPLTAAFDWGLPFFYGRSVYVAIEGHTTASGNGPFIAY